MLIGVNFLSVQNNSLLLQVLEEALISKKPSFYCLKHRTLKGKPMTFKSSLSPFKHRPWQVQIVDDTHPNKIVEKSRQLGFSEMGLSECIHFLDTNSTTKAMYTFPRDAQMRDFSSTRVKPLFAESSYLSSIANKSTDNMALKQIKDSYLFMRSAWGSALGEGVDLDYVAFDEYDRMKDDVELAFIEGLSSSKWGWIRRWSTPTIPGRGINLAYQKSDQMRYFWTCEHCGEKQYLTFEDNVIQVNPKGVNKLTQEIEDGTFIIGCKKCKKEINRWSIGEWVALNPSIRDSRGYHVSQLDACWITADSVMRRSFNYPSKQLFINYVVGEPYSASGLIIVDQDVVDSMRLKSWASARDSSYVIVSAGIDWGAMNWMILLGMKRDGSIDVLNIFWAEDNPAIPLAPVSYFATVLKAYNPNIIIADAGYGADRNTFLFTKFPDLFYACQWQTLKDNYAKVKFMNQWNENSHEVTVDKTSTMQRLLHRVKGRLIGVPPMDEKLAAYTKHLKNVRIMDMEDRGIVYQMATRIGPDHLACAGAYASIGMDKLSDMGVPSGFSWDFM